ncbi:MAG: hypothetical protein MI749_10310 [Desulfovibrionales bacterium]|nr:hypothetical protein [Desulfovibrionales bacterium]
MQVDNELMALCELSHEELQTLLARDVVEDVACTDAETRMLAYLHDLRDVLRMESGAGLRVLRAWLDEACMNRRLERDEHMREQVALQEFARDRMADVALADPVCHVRLQLQFSKEWAGGTTGYPGDGLNAVMGE